MAQQKITETKEDTKEDKKEETVSDTVGFKVQWGSKIGGDGGNAFEPFGKGTIEGVRLRGGGSVDAIELKVDGKWLGKHGGDGGSLSELILAKGEYIMSAFAHSGDNVKKLGFVTNFNNIISVGCDKGSNVGSQPGSNYGMLINIKGKSDKYLNQIYLQWGPAPDAKKVVPKWGPVFGQNMTNKWDIGDSLPKKITGVRMFGGTYVDSIEFQVDSKWLGKHGGKGGDGKTLILENDEYFNDITIKSGKIIDNIKISTNKSHSIQVGGNGGGTAQDGDGKHILVNARGCNDDHLCQIQFMWLPSDAYTYTVESKLFEFNIDAKTTPLVVATQTLDNSKGTDPQSMQFNVDESKRKDGFSVEVGTSFETGVPFVSKAKISIKANTSHTWRYGKKNKTKQNFKGSFPLNAGAGKIVKGEAVVMQGTLDIPYKMVLTNGLDHRVTSTGIWTGVSAWDLQFKVTTL